MSLLTNIKLSEESELHKSIWNGIVPKEDVAERLKTIGQVFVGGIEQYFDLVDVVIDGSLGGVNYNVNSDLDIAVVLRPKVNAPIDFIREYLKKKKRAFNLQHNIKIKGLNLEVTPELEGEPGFSAGRYSLFKKRWVVGPDLQLYTVPVEKTKQYLQIRDYIDELVSDEYNYPAAVVLEDKLYDYRKRHLSLYGEHALGNLIYKKIRMYGYLDKLKEFIKRAKDKNLSLK